jgi:hypothetical protein
MDEHGDLLLDIGEKSESRRRFNSMHVDSNGNEKEDLSGVTQRNSSGRSDIRYGNRENQQLHNGTAADMSVGGNQEDEMTRKVLLGEEHKSVIPKRAGPEETVEIRQAGCKTRRAQSSRSMTRQDSESDGSVKGFRCKGTPRNKAYRRILDRRRNRGHSSTSSDSSPEVGNGTRCRTNARGRTAFCA